jgi:hypothetical protein
MVKMGMVKRENFRNLHIKIQFLKPCNATTRMDTISEKPLSRIEEDIAVGLLIAKAVDSGNIKEGNKIIPELLKKYPEYYERIVTDMLVPIFRCDYRIKVFATFFSAGGYEIKTDGSIPIALWISENKRKKEMLPGETTYVSFLIPDDAESWKVWLPK